MSLSSSCMLIMSLMMVRIIGATHSPSPASQNNYSPSPASQNSITNSSIHCKIGEGPEYHKVTHGICSNRIQSWQECRAAFGYLQSNNNISADTYNNSIPANATEGSRRRLPHDDTINSGCYAYYGYQYVEFNSYEGGVDCGADTRTYCICRSTKCMKCTGGIGLGGDKPCQPCPKGHYCPNPAMPPIQCPIGTFNNDEGFVTSCKKCPVYSTNNKTGHWGCDICVPGYFYRSGACYPCNADTFSEGGLNATCQKCEVGKISSHAATECTDINALLNKVARLESMLSNPKYLCESASDFCGPGTKWMNGNCVSTFDGILEACKKARPGWEWTCESQSCHADAELHL
jgi:hypothetical protein